MNNLSDNSILIIIYFIVPGVLSYTTYVAIIGAPRRLREYSLLKWFIFGTYYNIVWYIILSIQGVSNLSDMFQSRTTGDFALRLFVSPLLFGIILALLSKMNLIRGMLNKFGIPVLHPALSAWDYVFINRNPCWIMITLIDGNNVYGYFGLNSSVSSDPDERDIYIEQVYTYDEDGEIIEDPHYDGMLIDSSQIRTIEFWSLEDGAKNNE